MATIITHSIFGIGLAAIFKKLFKLEKKFWFWCFILPIVPDLDVISFKFGIEYSSPWGHRGFTHSILFSILFSLFIVLISHRKSKYRFVYWFVYFLCLLSHPILDAFTNGGLGVAFFWPIDNTRYFFPWRVIEVSPIGVKRFMSVRGVEILLNELKYVIAPLISLNLLLYLFFKLKGRKHE